MDQPNLCGNTAQCQYGYTRLSGSDSAAYLRYKVGVLAAFFHSGYQRGRDPGTRLADLPRGQYSTAAPPARAVFKARLHELNTVPVSAKSTLLDTILEYIQNNLSDKLTVADTALHFHISQSTLTHLFHQEMGISFYRCVIQRRLVEAKNLIAQGIPMGQIGIRVGFQEYSAFYRAFKAEFGISPIQYRHLLTDR